MKFGKTTALIVAALVLGLAVGSVATGFAAPTTGTNANGTAGGLGLRLGAVMRDAGGRLSDVVADLTGQSADEVASQRQDGKSYAEIADAKGVETSAVIDEALKIREKVLADKVAEGTITQAQADAALARMKDRLADRVESTDAGCNGAGCGAGGGMGRGGGRGSGGNGGVCPQVPVTQ